MGIFRQIEGRDILRLARFNYVWLALGVIIIYYSLALDPFFSGENFIVIIRSVSVTGLYALANTMVFLGAGVDVSVIAIGATTAMVHAKLFHTSGISTHGALAIAIVFSAALGLANGLLLPQGCTPRLAFRS